MRVTWQPLLPAHLQENSAATRSARWLPPTKEGLRIGRNDVEKSVDSKWEKSMESRQWVELSAAKLALMNLLEQAYEVEAAVGQMPSAEEALTWAITELETLARTAPNA